MLCPSCRTENRPGASFCSHCGTPLESQPDQAPYASYGPQAMSQPEANGYEQMQTPDNTQQASKASLFGGSGLMTFGALIVLFAFMLPWASCSNIELSGLEIATQSSQYSGQGSNASSSLLILVPLGALGLMAIGVAGVVMDFTKTSLPGNLASLLPYLPLIAVLPGLCSCCPSTAFLIQMQNAINDPETMGMIQIEYGFWLTIIGLGIAFIGIIITGVPRLLNQHGSSSGGPYR